MNFSLKSFTKKLLLAQLIILVIFLSFMIIAGRHAIEGLTVVWNNSQLAFGFLIVEIYVFVSVLWISRFKKPVLDERQRLIDLKASQLSYDIVMFSLVGVTLYTTFVEKNNTSSSPIFWIIILSCFINPLAVFYYQKRI